MNSDGWRDPGGFRRCEKVHELSLVSDFFSKQHKQYPGLWIHYLIFSAHIIIKILDKPNDEKAGQRIVRGSPDNSAAVAAMKVQNSDLTSKINQPKSHSILKLYKETMTSSSYLDAPMECCRQQYPGFREWSVFCLFCQLCESMRAQTHTHTHKHTMS